jgi:hypothetical protein
VVELRLIFAEAWMGAREHPLKRAMKPTLVEDTEGDQATIPAIQITQSWFAVFKGRQQK